MQCSTTTFNNTIWQTGNLAVQLDASAVEQADRGTALSATSYKALYNDVWQRRESSNAPIRKIFFFFFLKQIM